MGWLARFPKSVNGSFSLSLSLSLSISLSLSLSLSCLSCWRFMMDGSHINAKCVLEAKVPGLKRIISICGFIRRWCDTPLSLNCYSQNICREISSVSWVSLRLSLGWELGPETAPSFSGGIWRGNRHFRRRRSECYGDFANCLRVAILQLRN